MMWMRLINIFEIKCYLITLSKQKNLNIKYFNTLSKQNIWKIKRIQLLVIQILLVSIS